MSETEKKEYNCDICDSVFDNEESLNKHVKYQHQLYQKQMKRKDERSVSEKSIEFLKKHPAIWSLASFVVWFGISFGLGDIITLLQNGMLQMIAFAFLGMGLGISLMYEFIFRGS
ncbi:MAG: hypothetical protein ACXAEU_13120 [Candidatus Hodarchaeales archaeon]|jgi:uncharacterized C2H2 Zn-finger protein